jgi:hypothetical protein
MKLQSEIPEMAGNMGAVKLIYGASGTFFNTVVCRPFAGLARG